MDVIPPPDPHLDEISHNYDRTILDMIRPYFLTLVGLYRTI